MEGLVVACLSTDSGVLPDCDVLGVSLSICEGGYS